MTYHERLRSSYKSDSSNYPDRIGQCPEGYIVMINSRGDCVGRHYSAPLLREIAGGVDMESAPRRTLASMSGRDDKEGISENVYQSSGIVR